MRRRIGFVPSGQEPEEYKVVDVGEYEGAVNGDGFRQDIDSE